MSKNDSDIGSPVAPPNIPSVHQRSGSIDTGGDRASHVPMAMKPAPAPYPRAYSYHPHYSSSRPPLPIQSVVTTSFSMDEEREDGSSRLPGHHVGGSLGHGSEYRSSIDDRHSDMREATLHSRSPSHGRDMHHGRDPPHYARDLPPVHESGAERRHSTHEMPLSRPVRIPHSPRMPGNDRPPYIQRTQSAGTPSSYRGGQVPLKRSFWHHSRPGEDYQASLPHEFMPPKRAKVTSSSRKDFVVTARPHPEEVLPPERHHGGSSRPWFNRALSWEAREEYYHRSHKNKSYSSPWARHSPSSYRDGEVPPKWSDAPMIPSPRARYSPSDSYERSAWNHPRAPPAWHQHSMSPEDQSWSGLQHRDEAESKPSWLDSRDREGHDGEVRRTATFESASDTDSFHHSSLRLFGPLPTPLGMDLSPASRKTGTHRNRSSMESRKASEDCAADRKTLGPIRLLALPEDRISLSETLCVVREVSISFQETPYSKSTFSPLIFCSCYLQNIEVFTATLNDVEAPAPGRKHAVVVGQVGLRCIHCRHTTRSSERVKRAVCYPSSIKRIYRTVIDMKLDHFLHCKFVPDALKETLTALKANNTRSTGTTMQYFIRAAASLGMVDGSSGVRLESPKKTPLTVSPESNEGAAKTILKQKSAESSMGSNANSDSPKSESDGPKDYPIDRTNSMSSESTHSTRAIDDSNTPLDTYAGKITLALPEDKMSLSPLRCFLREQVCAFSATEEDIAVRTPTTFSVSVGQVGIGCVHCLNQPAKLRLNRAVCFPFSIARIYQSVADIQRFHLSECKMVPAEIKSKFLSLQSASSKGSKGLATRQYWVTSAKKIGLVDTSRGIRFGRDPSLPEKKAISLDILAQVASNVTTANKPLVLPEDKPYIAQFLYVVMEQLQPCRFTEADRNKRRLKDVGCIGVECKHCAGQVDGRKFFWSSVNAVESNFVSVHTHMMECRMIPDPLKENLGELKKLRKEQTAALKTGSQKAFFSRVWKRLHGEERGAASKQDEMEVDSNLEETSPESKDKGTEKQNDVAIPSPGSPNMDTSSSPSSPNVEVVSDKMAVVSV